MIVNKNKCLQIIRNLFLGLVLLKALLASSFAFAKVHSFNANIADNFVISIEDSNNAPVLNPDKIVKIKAKDDCCDYYQAMCDKSHCKTFCASNLLVTAKTAATDFPPKANRREPPGNNNINSFINPYNPPPPRI